MKRLYLALLLSALSIVPLSAQDPKILTAGIKTFTAAGAGTVLVDSGAFAGDSCRQIQWLLISSTVAANVVLETRDASNATTTFSHIIPVGAMQPILSGIVQTFCLLNNERVRLILNNNITGSVQVTMRFE